MTNSRASSSRLASTARVGCSPRPTLASLYPAPRNTGKDMSAYSLFLLGYDTHEISLRLGISEAKVLKRITIARDVANNTHTEFEGRLL
ncbi:hypothetical protein GCM10011385_00050 [Nitratireductor aestuarii]|uniref:Uncharacterized protein n=2 Tax=Nitratireductor aestuarii TaxID=1735103 RepID=A0A916REF5_9HYPH|nr:hypothetical protein GCM10011385_00050 [Nitratireductor aestuarii]